MKTQLYYLTMIASLCIIGVCAIEPKIFENALGLAKPKSTESEADVAIEPFSVFDVPLRSFAAPENVGFTDFAGAESMLEKQEPLPEPVSAPTQQGFADMYILPTILPTVLPTSPPVIVDEQPQSFSDDLVLPADDTSNFDWSIPINEPLNEPSIVKTNVFVPISIPSAAHTASPPPNPPPAASLQPPAYKIENDVIAEWIPLPGTDLVARVGTEAILACDVITQARREAILFFRDMLKKMPSEEIAALTVEKQTQFINEVTAMRYSVNFEEQIKMTLLYNDFLSAQTKESIEQIEKNLSQEFDRRVIPQLLTEHNVRTLAELKKVLSHEFGSSLEREKLLFIRRTIGQQWLHLQVKEASGEATYPQMKEYYETHLKDFEFTGYVQWDQMSVKIGSDEKAAYDKIVWMGNSVAGGGIPFEVIAQKNSDGPTAPNGGRWDKTTKGSLRSKVIEEHIFNMPLHALSVVLKDDYGFHIVRVNERVETHYTPFIEAQLDIKKRIKKERTEKHQSEYFTALEQRFPIERWKPTLAQQQ